jgi:hypothetical protein
MSCRIRRKADWFRARPSAHFAMTRTEVQLRSILIERLGFKVEASPA